MSNIHFNHYRKAVVCLDYNRVYESIELAGSITGCNPNCIRHVCRGRQQTTKNGLGIKLRWMYATEYVEMYGVDEILNLTFIDRLDYMEEVQDAKLKLQD